MTSLPCDIVILPSDELAQKIIKLSQQLQSESTLFTLDGQNFYPHASLYMTQLKVDNMDTVKGLLAGIATKTKIISLNATRYDQDKGFIDAEYERNESVDRLQVAVLNAINPVRDGMREKDKVRMLEATGLSRDNYERYGYKYTGELFRPHTTITRFIDDNDIDTAGLPDPSQFSGQFVKLGLYEMGDNGTCIREIATFNLG